MDPDGVGGEGFPPSLDNASSHSSTASHPTGGENSTHQVPVILRILPAKAGAMAGYIHLAYNEIIHHPRWSPTLTAPAARLRSSLVPTSTRSSPITRSTRATSPSSWTFRITSLSLDVGSLWTTITPAVMSVRISRGFPRPCLLPQHRLRHLGLFFLGGPPIRHHLTPMS